MAAPATLDDLVKLIRKSGMVEEPRLDAYLDKLRTNGTMPTDVKKLAGSMVKDALITYFQAEQFMLGKWRGFTIGKYKLLERIGFGGMGQVFLCEHLYMKRRVAIKVLPPIKPKNPRLWAVFIVKLGRQPLWIIPISSAPTTSIKMAICTFWSWNMSTVPACWKL